MASLSHDRQSDFGCPTFFAFFAKGWEATPECSGPRCRFPKRSSEPVNRNQFRTRPWLLLAIVSLAINASAEWKEKVLCSSRTAAP